MKYKITRETLEHARRQGIELAEIEERIAQSYNTYRSPSFSKQRTSQKGNPADPTASAMYAREKLRARYDREYKQYEEFYRYVKTVIDDPITFCMIQTKYFFNLELPKTESVKRTAFINKYLKENAERLNAGTE